MRQAYRVTQNQGDNAYAESVTSSSSRARELERVLESTKPAMPYKDWDILIATPFRYPLPIASEFSARFRPAGTMRNVLYCSQEMETALYEFAYHFLRQRTHLKDLDAGKDMGQRTAFCLSIKSGKIKDLSKHRECRKIMSRTDYAPSHAYILRNSGIKVLRYPSCRDPKARSNYAVFDIRSLGRSVSEPTYLHFIYRTNTQEVRFWSAGFSVDMTVSRSNFE
ncbi:MAG: RES family NAD+ phosphorylase [Elusimicrobiota bacterium]|jgi:hypothetical protein